ncbi:hypothetical protein HKD37_04G009487 [Glycine soja]
MGTWIPLSFAIGHGLPVLSEESTLASSDTGKKIWVSDSSPSEVLCCSVCVIPLAENFTTQYFITNSISKNPFSVMLLEIVLHLDHGLSRELINRRLPGIAISYLVQAEPADVMAYTIRIPFFCWYMGWVIVKPETNLCL